MRLNLIFQEATGELLNILEQTKNGASKKEPVSSIIDFDAQLARNYYGNGSVSLNFAKLPFKIRHFLWRTRKTVIATDLCP